MEPDLQGQCRQLHDRLGRIKALMAWLQLKHSEAQPRRIWAFEMHDSAGEDLKHEYTCFVADCARLRATLHHLSSHISQAVQEGIQRQLTHLEQQVIALGLHQRFGGLPG